MSQSHNRGTPRTSTTRASTKDKLNSIPGEKISKYFTEKVTYQVPLKDIKDIKPVSLNNSDLDFKNPIPPKKVRKVVQPAPKKKYVRKSKEKLVQSVLEVRKNFESEQLQLALALSKSLHKSPVKNEDEIKREPPIFLSTQEVRANVKRTLEEYGFKSKRYKSEEDAITHALIEVPKRRKRARYVTPIIYIRTEEDRKKIIEQKVATILNTKADFKAKQFVTTLTIFSKKLQRNYCESARIYNVNKLDVSLFDIDIFYVHALNLKLAENKCGSFLKNWADIPGREITPPREILNNSSDTVINCLKNENFVSSEVILDREDDSVNDCTSSKSVDNTFPIITDKMLDSCKNISNESGFKVNGNNTKSFLNDKKNETFTNITSFQSTPKANKKSITNCVSPDLFDSDEDDVMIINVDGTEKNFITQNDNGICHFESFHDDEIYIQVANTKQIKTPNFIISRKSSPIKLASLNESNLSPIKNCPGDKSLLDDSIDLTGSDDDLNISNKLKINETESNSLEKSFKRNDSLDSSKSCESIEISDEELNFSSMYASPKINRKNKFAVSSDSEEDDDFYYSKRFKSLIGLPLESKIKEAKCADGNNSNKIENNTFEPTENILKHPRISELLKFDKSKLPILGARQNTHPIIEENVNTQNNTMKVDSCQKSDELGTLINEKENLDTSYLNSSYSEFYPSDKDVRVADNQPTTNFSSPVISDNNPQIMRSNLSPERDISGANYQFMSPKLSSCPSDRVVEYQNTSNLSSPILAYYPTDKQILSTDYKTNSAIISHNNPQIMDDVDVTPDKNLIIKTSNVTPMCDYENMNSPEILSELQKYGVKKLNRHRAVSLLKYLYESTHPTLNDNTNFPKKRRKLNLNDNEENGSDHEEDLVAEDTIDLNKSSEEDYVSNDHVDIVGDLLNLETDVILEKQRSKKINTCNLPLHIAWHNLISANPRLHEDILLYKPIKIEVIYKMLKEQGSRYEIKELITFLDKKCITIKISQKGYKKKK